MTLPLRSKRRREPDVRNSTARTRDLGTRLPVEQRGTTAGLTASGNVASMREPLDGSLWWYWIAANATKKNGASFKNYHRLTHLFYLCGVQIRQSLLCNMRDWSQG